MRILILSNTQYSTFVKNFLSINEQNYNNINIKDFYNVYSNKQHHIEQLLFKEFILNAHFELIFITNLMKLSF